MENLTLLHAYVADLQRLYDTPRYISHNDLFAIIQKYQTSTVKSVSFWHLLYESFIYKTNLLKQTYSERKHIRQLTSRTQRMAHNEQFIERRQHLGYQLGSNQLDYQQIEAVVANEDTQLVLAAAGSGKTLSLLAKCQYLVKECGVSPDKILTISFTKKSADELNERLKELNIPIKGQTFHALGKSIIDTGRLRVADAETQQRYIKQAIDELHQTDTTFMRQFNDYLLTFFTAPISLSEVSSMEQMVRLNKSFTTKTLKAISLNKQQYAINRPTIKGDYVRSKEEQIIANFLFINQIPYEYEQPYPGNTRYHPDFTITQFSEPIYLEHQGISRDGKTRADIDPAKYNQKIYWDKKYHKEHGTTLIETFSYEFSEGTILTNLEKRLRQAGVQLVRREESEISQLIQDGYKTDYKKLNELLVTFLGLFKSNDQTIDKIYQKMGQLAAYQQIRTKQFLALFQPIYEKYQTILQTNQSIDFTDMIVQATHRLANLAPDDCHYDYILVDEIQDLSASRYRLLKALLDHNPKAKLFAVGDDWQSIFRFAGSDITLLQDFKDKFDRTMRRSVIEQTHRFGDPVMSLSSSFIKKNPSQSKKTLRSSVSHQTPLTLSGTSTASNDINAADMALKKLIDTYTFETNRPSFLLLSRYNYDIHRLDTQFGETTQSPFNIEGTSVTWKDSRSSKTYQLQFSTMHKAKGLTCDFTIILNANEGAYGIPAERDDDPVISLLLAHPDHFPDAEERRLFYVAMTRAKYETVILYDPDNPSPFLADLQPIAQLQPSVHRCPVCHIGSLVQRHGPYGDFLSCSNFKYGCTYTENVPTRTAARTLS